MSNAISKDALEEVKKLCEAAYDGPWRQGTGSDSTVFASYPYTSTRPKEIAACSHVADAAFIAQARTLVPQLLAEVELLRSIVEDVSAIVGHPDAPYHPDLLEILNRKASGGSNANG